MALWICTACTCRYSVGAPRCPQCDSTEYVEEGAEDMAKITVHGGASNAAAEDEAADETTEQAGEESSEASEEPAPPEQDYEDATVDELKELLAARGLSKTGKRDDLVARLREDDATRAAGAE